MAGEVTTGSQDTVLRSALELIRGRGIEMVQMAPNAWDFPLVIDEHQWITDSFKWPPHIVQPTGSWGGRVIERPDKYGLDFVAVVVGRMLAEDPGQIENYDLDALRGMERFDGLELMISRRPDIANSVVAVQSVKTNRLTRRGIIRAMLDFSDLIAGPQGARNVLATPDDRYAPNRLPDYMPDVHIPEIGPAFRFVFDAIDPAV